MNKSLFVLLSSLITINCFTIERRDGLHDSFTPTRPAAYAAPKIGVQGIIHSKDGFAVVKNGKAHPVPTHLVAKKLRNRTNQQMAQYLAHHQVCINKADENEFSVSEGTRALGGGPIVAGWVYSITKGTC